MQSPKHLCSWFGVLPVLLKFSPCWVFLVPLPSGRSPGSRGWREEGHASLPESRSPWGPRLRFPLEGQIHGVAVPADLRDSRAPWMVTESCGSDVSVSRSPRLGAGNLVRKGDQVLVLKPNMGADICHFHHFSTF